MSQLRVHIVTLREFYRRFGFGQQYVESIAKWHLDVSTASLKVSNMDVIGYIIPKYSTQKEVENVQNYKSIYFLKQIINLKMSLLQWWA